MPRKHYTDRVRSRRLREYDAKLAEVLEVRPIIIGRRGCKYARTEQILAGMGYKCEFRRIRAEGGVGTFTWMRNKRVFRVQVSATIQWRHVGNYFIRYAYCIEI